MTTSTYHPYRSWLPRCMEILPHHFLSACVYEATRCRLPAWKNLQIRHFVKHFQVELEEAVLGDAHSYSDFNAFFTRALRPETRPIAYGDNTLVCPSDGCLSTFGAIKDGQLLQAKGKNYSLAALLGGDQALARQLEGGGYLTVYLSPRDYHRVHMPATGRLENMIHVPGRLFSVNAGSAASVNNLFARNERVISRFETPLGTLIMILVGAMFVGTIEQVWAGQVAPAMDGDVRRVDYSMTPEVRIRQGSEMGRFNMGSTVVLLLENPNLQWLSELRTGQKLKMGQALARTQGL